MNLAIFGIFLFLVVAGLFKESRYFKYLIFVCSLVFPALIIFGNEYSNLNLFVAGCLFWLLILSSMVVYMQEKKKK